MTDLSTQIDQVGDALQRAWREDQLRHGRRPLLRRPRRLVLGLALVAAVLGGGAAIAATMLKSAADEQQGMVGGHEIFAGSQPSCEALTASSFRCTLDKPPTGMTFGREDPAGSIVYRGKRYTPAFDIFLGMKFPTVDSTHHVDGACVSISADGRTWNCYLGQSAVEQGIIGPTMLGHYQPDRPTG